jgi:4-hydroxybenzoate polyprenyltransferase
VLLLMNILRAMRPKQWVKNGIIFFPFAFTLHEYWTPFSAEMYRFLALTTAGFVIFCLLSGAVYLINDIADIEKDRLHPKKRNRPIASGTLSVRAALVAAIVLAVGSIGAGLALSIPFGLIAAAYFAVQLAYNYVLKQAVLLDVFTIAAGFVLRAVAGAVVIQVAISPWLYICTILLSLFLGFSKRRHELVLLNDQAGNHRQILREYTPELLEEILSVVTSSTVMAYSLYTFTYEKLPKNHAMMLTIPFALYGIFRYLYLVHLKNEGGSPEEILLGDKPFLINIVLWMSSVVIILYFFR